MPKLFSFQVEVLKARKVKEKDYFTSYKCMVERSKNKRGFLYSLFSIFGPKYRKLTFILVQLVFTSISILPAYYFYFQYVSLSLPFSLPLSLPPSLPPFLPPSFPPSLPLSLSLSLSVHLIILTILCLLFNSKTTNMLFFFIVFAVVCYNGASFYVDVLGHKYYTDKEIKLKVTKIKSRQQKHSL